tara:strand:- start:56 stop:256 length:201 start_codon:yes stop_codon:yes gene_type:complete
MIKPLLTILILISGTVSAVDAVPLSDMTGLKSHFLLKLMNVHLPSKLLEIYRSQILILIKMINLSR